MYEIYGCLITVTGWSFREVENLPFRRALQLFKYWRISPPVHILMRMRYGYKAPTEIDPEESIGKPTGEEEKIASGLPRRFFGSEPPYRQIAIKKALEEAEKRRRNGG